MMAIEKVRRRAAKEDLMRRSMLTVIACLTIIGPVAAAGPVFTSAAAAGGAVIEIGQKDGAPIEVRILGADGQTLVDPNGELSDEDGGCIEIFANNMLDFACGDLGIAARPALIGATMRAQVASTLYAYDPETVSFTEIGPSTIDLDLTLTGEGAPRVEEPGNAVGVCGLPPDTRGAFVIGNQAVERAAIATGSLTSAIGAVDPSTLNVALHEFVFAYAGACAGV